MSDQHPIGNLSDVDAAMARVRAQMRETDRQIEVLQYLSNVAERVKRAFLGVASEVENLQRSGLMDPVAVGDRFESRVVQLLEGAVEDARAVQIEDPDLAATHALATTALETDLVAFRQLAQAYRSQDQQQLAAAARQRESAAVSRRQWIEHTLELGQSVGVYDAPGQ